MTTKDNKLTKGNGQNQAELVMDTSLQLLPLIMNNIPQAVFWKDRDLVYLGCNQAFAEDTGFSSPEEIVGKTDFDMPWKEQAELYRADDRLVMETGESKLNYEEPQTSPNGSTIWLSTSKIPVTENGQIIAVLGMYEDITARKQAEADLLLRDRALASSLNAVIIVNISDNKPIYVNDALLKMTGYNREEVMQIGLSDITGNADEPKKIRAAIQTQGFFVGDELLKRKDGSVFPANFFSSLIIGAEGRPVAVQTSFFDITERKQAEKALRESEDRFRRFTEATNEGLVFHEQGRIIDANPAGLAMFGLSDATEFIGKSLLEFLAPESHQMVMQQMQLENVLPYEVQCIHKNGSTFPVETSTRTYKLDEHTIRATSIRDISDRKKAEEAIRQSQTRFQTLVETLNEWVWEVDKNGNYTYVSPNIKNLLGYEPDEIVGKSPFDLMPSEEAQRVAGVFGPLLSTQLPLVALENTNQHKDGHLVVLETNGVPFFDANGQLLGYRGTDRDISARKQAEQALRDSEARYSAVVTQAMDGVVIIQDNIIQFVNEAMAHMLRYTPAEMENTPIINYIAPESKSLILNRIKARLAGQEVPSVYESKLLCKDGTIIDAELSAGVIEYHGKPADVGMIRDITKRKEIDNAVRESEERFRRFSEATVEGLVFHEQGKVVDVNPAAVALFGLSNDSDLIGRNLFEFIVPEFHQLVLDQMQLESVTPYEIRGIRKDGSTIPVETSTRAYKVGDRVIRASSIRDITERKRLEQQIQTAFERRGYQVQISTELSQEIAAASELNELFGRVVTLTKERLGYYHTQLLRYDAAQDAVVLINGYGETGNKMLSRGHKLPMGTGLIGTAAASGETILRSTLTDDPDWQPNPLLPDTKGEIAVPIKLGEQVLGVLDIQSDQAGALAEDDRLLLEGLCGQVAVAIEQTRLRQEMAERLEEVNRLYRNMSREGWQTYRDTTNLPAGFMFDQASIKPVDEEVLADELFANIPMTVPGGEAVGMLTVANDPRHPTSPEDYTFLQQVSDQIALALESARLFEQTQSALAQTEKLSEAGLRFARSTDLQELLAAITETLGIPVVNRGIMGAFNYNSTNELESMDILANWWNRSGLEPTSIGTHYSLESLHAMSIFLRTTATFLSDMATDKGIGASALEFFKQQNINSVAVLPLYLGIRHIGVLFLEAEEIHNFTQDEIRMLSAMAPQIATALENRRQYERAQQQAERESTLNVISQKIQSATTVEAVLQIAARELGHALGAPMTIAQLSMKDKK